MLDADTDELGIQSLCKIKIRGNILKTSGAMIIIVYNIEISGHHAHGKSRAVNEIRSFFCFIHRVGNTKL